MDVVAYGVPVMDLLISLDRMPGANEQNIESLQTSWQYGGKVSTALAAVARLGMQGGIVAEIAGLPGSYIKQDFEWHGIDTSHLLRREKGESWMGLCLADLKTGGRTFIKMNPDFPTQGVEPWELDREYITSGKFLLLSAGDPTSRQCAAWCREAGIPTVIDADTYGDEIQEMLPLLDHFIPSEFYYQHLYGDSKDYRSNLLELRALQQNPAAATILTIGERGVVGYDQQGRYFHLPAYAVNVVDTTGAGDVFHGAYIVGLLTGRSVEEACRLASAVSAIKCTRLGGRAAIPSLPVAEEFMRSGRIEYEEIDQRVEHYRRMPFQA